MPAPPRRVAVIVNARAGTVLQRGGKAFTRHIVEAFARNGCAAEVTQATGPSLGRRLEAALAGAYDLVVVSGGDGTLSHMLPQLMEARTPVGVLPLGTLNLFGADLGLMGALENDVAGLARGAPRTVDLGLLNGAPFHSVSGVGYSVMMARERERARRRLPSSKTLSFAWAALRTLFYAKPVTVDILVDGEHRVHEADGVLVTNNRFDGAPWRRASMSDGLLEVHTFKAGGLFGRIRTVIAVARGRWRQLDSLETIATTEVTLRRRGRRRFIVATDGEIRLMRGELRYEILPRALTVVAPAQAAAR